LKVLNQPTKFQPLIVQLVFTIGMVSLINRDLFEKQYMKQNAML